MRQYFEQQIAGGATDNFFYGTEHNGEVRIERHRGTIDKLLLDHLEFDRMMGSTPFFKPKESQREKFRKSFEEAFKDGVDLSGRETP